MPNIQEQDQYVLIGLENVIPETIDTVKRALAAVPFSDNKPVAVDLRALNHVYSLDVSLLVHLFKKAREANAKIAVVNVCPAVRTTLESVNLQKQAPLFKTLTEFENAKDIAHEPTVEAHRFTAETETQGDLVLIKFHGMLTGAECVDNLCNTLEKAESMGDRFVFDYADLDMMDSIGISFLVQFAQKVRARNGAIAVAAANPVVADLLRILSLDKVVALCDSIKTAKDVLK